MKEQITNHERLRRTLGYSVTAWARELGFSQPYVSQIESCQTKASPRYQEALHAHTHASLEALFDKNGFARGG